MTKDTIVIPVKIYRWEKNVWSGVLSSLL